MRNSAAANDQRSAFSSGDNAGFPPDDSASFRREVIRWLESVDGNGVFSDEDSACAGMGPLTIADAVALAAGWAKNEVSGDRNCGVVPLASGTFAGLGRVRPFAWSSSHPRHYLRFWNAVRRELAAWIATGMREE
jgi:hypothetical protein